jgi:hypothetical protein
LKSAVVLQNVVGSAVVARAFLLQTVVARIVVQQNVVRSAVVARAAVEPNWDLPYLPCKKWRTGPMSRRGTSFGTNFGARFWVSFRIGKSSSRQEFRVRLYEKTHTPRLSVQKFILVSARISIVQPLHPFGVYCTSRRVQQSLSQTTFQVQATVYTRQLGT